MDPTPKRARGTAPHDGRWRTVSTSLSPDERRELHDACEKRGVSVYQALREAVAAWIEGGDGR